MSFEVIYQLSPLEREDRLSLLDAARRDDPEAVWTPERIQETWPDGYDTTPFTNKLTYKLTYWGNYDYEPGTDGTWHEEPESEDCPLSEARFLVPLSEDQGEDGEYSEEEVCLAGRSGGRCTDHD